MVNLTIKKMKNILIKVLAFILIAPAFTGCLDDDKYALDPAGTKNTLEFGTINPPVSPFGAVYPLYVVSFGVSEEDEFEIVLNYAGPNDNDKDIELTLEVDPVAVELYNAQYGAHYTVLPDALFDMETMTVTIEKGKKSVTLPITIYPDQYDLSLNYILPLKIAEASSGTISSNFGTALFATVVKNRYDGVYTIAAETASFQDVNLPLATGIYPKTIEFRTINGNTVEYFDKGENLKGHIWSNSGTGTYYGGFIARITFDDATGNVTSVVNGFGQGNNNRSGKLDPAQSPVAKMTFEADGVTPVSMTLWYIMVQVSTDRTFFKETYEYVGPRD